MAIGQAALYFEAGAVDVVADLLGPVFAQQCEAVGRAKADLWLLAFGGWVLVQPLQALDGAAIIAEGLSRELHARTVVMEFSERALRWDLRLFHEGRQVESKGFGTVSADEPTPLYPDIELEAYRALCAMGVPGEMALACPGVPGAPTVAAAALQLRWADGKLAREAREVSWLTHPAGMPPVQLETAALDSSAERPLLARLLSRRR